MCLAEITMLEETIDSFNRFANFYKNEGNADMCNYYLRRIDDLEIKISYLKE